MSGEVENVLIPVRDLMERLKSEASNSGIKDKREQLKAVSRSIEQLESKGVPVPEELRRLKMSLMSETEQAEKATDDLGELQKGLQDIMRGLDKHSNSEISTPRRNRSRKERTQVVGDQTPQSYYKPLIVEYLKSKGGSARASDIVKWIQDRMEGKFLPGDFQLRADGRHVIWRNNIRWARNTLVKEGILKNDSSRGFWELK